jgi:hypothetical protein
MQPWDTPSTHHSAAGPGRDPSSAAAAVTPSLSTARPDSPFVRRTGVIGRWLDLTAPPRPRERLPVRERERLRKAELTSLSILVVFGFLLALVANSLADPGTAQAVIGLAIFLIIGALLNRFGYTRAAAYLIPSALMLVIAAAILAAPGGLRPIVLPAYDLFVIPIILVALIGDRIAPWLFAAAAITFIVGDFLTQPQALILVAGMTPFNEIAYETHIFGVWGMIDRHILVNFFAAFIGWLGARSVDAAIARADNAEEIAALEHAIAEQKRQLEEGIQQILTTHVRVANGDLSARAPLAQDHVLWQVAWSLNNLLSRLQKAAQATYQLQRVQQEVDRLAHALQEAQAGRQPIWPAPSGTPVDRLIAVLATHDHQTGLHRLVGSKELAPQGPVKHPATPAPMDETTWSTVAEMSLQEVIAMLERSGHTPPISPTQRGEVSPPPPAQRASAPGTDAGPSSAPNSGERTPG